MNTKKRQEWENVGNREKSIMERLVLTTQHKAGSNICESSMSFVSPTAPSISTE